MNAREMFFTMENYKPSGIDDILNDIKSYGFSSCQTYDENRYLERYINDNQIAWLIRNGYVLHKKFEYNEDGRRGAEYVVTTGFHSGVYLRHN